MLVFIRNLLHLQRVKQQKEKLFMRAMYATYFYFYFYFSNEVKRDVACVH